MKELITIGISGLTNQQLFSLLNNGITSPSAFTNALISSGYLTGSNTPQKVNNLFNSY